MRTGQLRRHTIRMATSPDAALSLADLFNYGTKIDRQSYPGAGGREAGHGIENLPVRLPDIRSIRLPIPVFLLNQVKQIIIQMLRP